MPKITPIRAPFAPKHLSAASKRLYRDIVGTYELEAHHRVLLLTCCEALDRAAEARLAVERDGAYSRDKFNQVKPHPGLNEERQSKLLAAKCLRELGLDLESANSEANRIPAIGANNWRGRA